MQAAEQRLRQNGCRGAVIGVLTFKAPKLLPFYQPLGYVDTGRPAAPMMKAKAGCTENTSLIIMFKAFELSS
jgi:hypothetical protein